MIDRTVSNRPTSGERRADARRGWLFVAVQLLLLGGLVLLPTRGDWPTPDWLRSIGYALVLGGLTLVAVASLGLGRALTPTPVPNRRAELQTNGLYRRMRHPIYTGVLAIVVGLVLRSGSVITLALGIVTFLFFGAKARWEEAKLAEAYPDYPRYAARTPRFVPRLRRRN